MGPAAEHHQVTLPRATGEHQQDRAVLQGQQEVFHLQVVSLPVIHSHPQAAHVQAAVASAVAAAVAVAHVQAAAAAAVAVAEAVVPAAVAEEEEGNSSYHPLL